MERPAYQALWFLAGQLNGRIRVGIPIFAPAGNLIEMAPFDSLKLDFILDGSHVWILPHRKTIPQYYCLLIFLQIYLEPVLGRDRPCLPLSSSQRRTTAGQRGSSGP